MNTFRATIKSAIIESASLLTPHHDANDQESDLDDAIVTLICEYSGYADFIHYKFKYPPNHNLFDTRVSSCEPFGFLAGQRVFTMDGDAICIGVAPSTLTHKATQNELYFDLMDRNTNQWRRLCYPSWKREQFIANGFFLLDGFVNIWGQHFHSFNTSDESHTEIEWWKADKYAIHNPLNMPTTQPPLDSVAPIPTAAPLNTTILSEESDLSLWFWSATRLDLTKLDKYDERTSERIERLDIGRCFIYSNYDSKRVYLICKTATDMGYQLNMDSRYVRRIIKGTAIQRIQKDPPKTHESTMVHHKTNLSWFWEGDTANLNIWNKYDEEMCHLINNHSTTQYGSAIPHTLVKKEHKFKHEIVRLSRTEGIQRNVFTGFSRRIVREDHGDIDVDTMVSSDEYDAKLKAELRGSDAENDGDHEEKYEFKHEPNVQQPTSTIAALATGESSVPLTPKTVAKEKQPRSEKETATQYKAPNRQKLVIAPQTDKAEDAQMKAKKHRTWRWTKAFMFTGYVLFRGLSLLDLWTDIYLLYKAQLNDVILLTVTLFISIFAPYVLSYSSGIKLFIFRKTFDHLQGFKKIFLLLYLLPTGFLYFIFIDIIDSLFTLYKWVMYNGMSREEKDIKETEELLAQQLGMDRMNWEGFKRQKAVGQLMFETIPQVILQGLIAFDVGGMLVKLEGTTITKRDVYISVGCAVINSIRQITTLYLESIAVQESFIQYALTCMMGRVGWVPFRHKIQRIFTNKNINTSDANNTIVNLPQDTLTQDLPQKDTSVSDLEVIDFNIRYRVPILSAIHEALGFKHKLQGTIEYDFSTVTIRYLIATLLVLQNASSDDQAENGNQKSRSIQIKFGDSLRLLGVHDISLLLETCRKKNIVLGNVKDIVKWTHAFEISTIKDRKDPRLISYSRDEQGRPLLIGLYLSGYDPDKHILRELLHNDVPINLEDASGETIVYHLIRQMDYAGIRELFKTKYEKDEKRSNIYLNIYNRSGYSPLYLALHQHLVEVTQRDIDTLHQKKNDEDIDEEEAFAFKIDEPAPKVRSKVTFKEEKVEEEFVEDIEMAAIPSKVAQKTKEAGSEEETKREEPPIQETEMDPLVPKNDDFAIKKKRKNKKKVDGTTTKAPMAPSADSVTKAPMAPSAPIAPTARIAPMPPGADTIPKAPIAAMAPIAPMAPAQSAPLLDEDNDLYELPASASEPKLISTMNPLNMLESVKIQKYAKMWKDGQPMEQIEAQMRSNGVDPSLLQRYIHHRKGKKSRKKSKKTLKAMNQELHASNTTKSDTNLSREQIKKTLARKLRRRPSPMQKAISDTLRKKPSPMHRGAMSDEVGISSVLERTKQMEQREDRQRREEKRKQKHETKQKNIANALEDNLIELVKTERFASETIINTLRFKLQDELWNNLMTLFEHYEMIRCVYQCKEACHGMLISTQCTFLSDYTKMAKLGATLVQIETKIKKDKYLTQQQRHAFIKAYKCIENDEWMDGWIQRDTKIVMKVKEQLEKTRQRSKYEIFKIIPRIMDAQNMIKLEARDNSIKQFINKGSMHTHAVMNYIHRFEEHCDIKMLEQALDLKLSSPDLQAFAPLTGSYKQYLVQQQKEEQTLPELMKTIQSQEREKIEAKLVSFAYDHMRGYYLDYFADQKEDHSDDEDEDILDAFNDRQWMYQILLSHNSDPNFQCNSGGLSPLAYVLTNLFEHIYVANDLVSRGAKLQAKEKHIMVNIFVHSAFQAKGKLYLDICMRICRKSEIHLSNIRDQNGNNPMHLAVLRTDDTQAKQPQHERKRINHKFIRQKQKALQLLNETYPKWLAQKNKNDMYPLTIAVKFRDIDSTMCLGSIGAGSLQQKMKSIVSHREFVMDLIVWVVTVLLTAHPSNKWDGSNYDKLMQVELLFSVFEYTVSFQWPSSYIKTNEIIHLEEFQKENIDLKSFSLISYCYDKRLYSVLELLTTEFNILRYLSTEEHLKVREMQREIKEFTGQMFVESKKKFETQWQENILDKIKNDMLLENDFGTPDFADVASRFVTSDTDYEEEEDDSDDEDEHKERKKAVSWIEVIYSTTVEGLSTADFITDILILRDLWVSNNLWWTTFMLSLLIAPYLVCYSALGSLIQHRMNFIYLTMSIDDDGDRVHSEQCSKKCKWFSFNFLVLLLMTPLCIGYFVIIDIVFMIYVMFATSVFFLSCTKWDIGDAMDDWVFKKIFGLNRMQIIGYRRLRTLSQLFFETIPQIFLQLRILWQIEWAGNQNEFEINSEAILWSVGFALLHLIFEAAIISLDSSASKMKFIHYAIVCLGARLDWIPFSHLFSKKAREIQDVIDKKDYRQPIDIKQEYFESEHEDMRPQLVDDINKKHEPFNYEEIAAGLCGLRYKLEFQFSNESMNKLAETLTYLPSPTLPTNQTSNVLLKSLLNSVLLEPLMMEVVIGGESCRNVDMFSVAELYRSTVHRVHLNIAEIDMYRVIHNSHIGNKSDDNKRKMLSLLMEEFINYGELFVVEWLCQKHLGLNKDPQSIKSWIILNSLGGVNGIQIADSANNTNLNIEGGKFEILRKYYTEGLVFGLDCKLAKVIYKYIYHCLQRALQEHTYFYVALFILWYTRCNIYHHCCSLGCCKVQNELQSIQSNKKMTTAHSPRALRGGGSGGGGGDLLVDKLHKYVPQILEIGDWEMSFRLTECFAVFKVHLEELLLNELKDSTNKQHHVQSEKKKKKKKGRGRGLMWRVATTMDFQKTASHILNVNDEYTQRVLGLDFYKLAVTIQQSDIDLLQAIIDTSIHKLHSFPLHSFFVSKVEALDVLVTQLRMTYEYHKYIVATKKYRNKDVCFMGENGKIINDLHLTHATRVKTIHIPMTELYNFLPIMHLGILKLRFNLKNVQSSLDREEEDEKERKYDDDKNKKKRSIGQIKLWWINPIETGDKKLSKNAGEKKRRRIETPEWNQVYLRNSSITFKMINDGYFDVSIVDVFGLCMYNRRVMDYGKIPPLYLELSVQSGHNLHCDGIELEIEFMKSGMRKISVTDEEKPIHRFCKNNSLKLLKYIVPTYIADRTFDINKGTKRTKETPLHITCSNTVINYDIVELLIQNGIEINKQNKEKDTALDIIQKKKNKNANISDLNHNVEQLLIKNKAVFNTQKPKKSSDPRLKEYLNMLKIGVPIWAVIQYMKKQGADRGLIQDVERMQIQSEEADELENK